jgi:hypothetical protein
MTIVLTLCSANYLAHARVLGESLREHNPDAHFVLGLVDRVPGELDPSFWKPFELLPVESIGMAPLAEMIAKYNIVELNTAVKPFYIDYLYRRDPNVRQVIYMDPDMMVCGSLEALRKRLQQFNVVLTPHSCTYDDSPENIHYEQVMLWAGVFNLGFIATARSDETLSFLRWWQIRVRDHCHYRPGVAGSFFDQLWIGLAPVYFHGVHVETDPGYNICYWNLFERRLSLQDGRHLVNGKHPLVCFHFSGYKPEQPERVVSRSTEPVPTFAERPDIRELYDQYRERLLAAGYERIRPIPWRLKPATPRRRTVRSLAKGSLRRALRLLPAAGQEWLKRSARFVIQSCR